MAPRAIAVQRPKIIGRTDVPADERDQEFARQSGCSPMTAGTWLRRVAFRGDAITRRSPAIHQKRLLDLINLNRR